MIPADVIESIQHCLIRYLPKGTSYIFKGPIRMKINGAWVVYYSYHDFQGNAYARSPDNFQDFELCFKRRI